MEIEVLLRKEARGRLKDNLMIQYLPLEKGQTLPADRISEFIAKHDKKSIRQKLVLQADTPRDLTECLMSPDPAEPLEKLIAEKKNRCAQLEEDKKFYEARLRGIGPAKKKGGLGKKVAVGLAGLLVGFVLALYT